MISSVILTTFISLHCFTCIRCSDDHDKEIENQNEIINKNDIDDIIKKMEDNHTGTIFKIIITPGNGVKKLGIEQALRDKGVQEGDTVHVLEWDFEWYD